MREFPFEEIKITENKVIRIFDAENTSHSELIWHKDREDREITVEKSKDWHLQLENEVPVKLEIHVDRAQEISSGNTSEISTS